MFNNISSQAKNLINLAVRHTNETKTQVITVTSGKGGVGKSTFTANIAYIMADMGYKVAVDRKSVV